MGKKYYSLIFILVTFLSFPSDQRVPKEFFAEVIELVANGYALHFRKYSKDTSYSILEESAHVLKKGMWSQEKLMEPWLFRKRKKSKKI